MYPTGYGFYYYCFIGEKRVYIEYVVCLKLHGSGDTGGLISDGEGGSKIEKVAHGHVVSPTPLRRHLLTH